MTYVQGPPIWTWSITFRGAPPAEWRDRPGVEFLMNGDGDGVGVISTLTGTGAVPMEARGRMIASGHTVPEDMPVLSERITDSPLLDYKIGVEYPTPQPVYRERQRPRGPDDVPEGRKPRTSDETPGDALDAGRYLSHSGEYGVVSAWKDGDRYRGALWRYLSVVDRLDTADRDEALAWFAERVEECGE